MKKLFSYILIIFGVSMSYAQANIDSRFYEAQALNIKKDYASAAEKFVQIQEQTLKTGDMKHYVLSATAEGECYYMLDIAVNMKSALEKAKSAFNEHFNKFEEKDRLELQETIYKLEGAYHSCRTAEDSTAFTKSKDAYMKCLEILKSIENKDLEINVHRELVTLYYNQKLYDEALQESEIVYYHRRDIGYDSEDKSIEGMRDYDNFVDAYVCQALILARLKRFDEASEVLAELPEECEDEASVLRTKGKILMLQYAHDGTDNRNTAKTYYERYITKFKQEFNSQLATLSETQREQYWLSIHDFLYDCYCLGEYASDLLYDIALFSKGYLLECKSNKQAKPIKWTDVSKKLKKSECAIEFVQYKNQNEEKLLGALVIRNNSLRPEFVHIGSVKEIVNSILPNGQSAEIAITNDIGASKDVLYTDTAFFKKIWTEEVQHLIGNSENIYFAPDGFLHHLAVEYMYPNPSVNCYRLSSTKLLVDVKQSKLPKMLLCGGIDYYANVKSKRTDNDINGYNKFGGKSFSVNYLKGTEAEVDSIYSYKKSTAIAGDTLLRGERATDETFCDLAQNGYSIIHIATHGYFSGKNEFNDLKPVYRDQGMSESGIMMAGMVKNVNNKDFNPTFSDGILTAKELSELKLCEVDLVVLSACQSGLGYITDDGVCGIQRALKLSGVKAMIVSLWSVDDAATMEFMKLFYKELNKKQSSDATIRNAFNNARKYLMQESKVVVNSCKTPILKRIRRNVKMDINTPQYTNAFVLIDGL